MARQPKKKTTNQTIGKIDNVDIFKEIAKEVDISLTNTTLTHNTVSGDRIRELAEEEIWEKGTILNFKDFVESADHMNFPPLSDRQLAVAEYLLGNEPKKIFDNNRNIAVLVYGKGAGKDTLSALIQLYVSYVLLHMKNPQKFFDIGPTSSIDLLNIASTREQAQEVYFQLLKGFIIRWQWLRNKYDFVVNGRFFSVTSSDMILSDDNKVIITNESIIFPKNIKMISGSSEADSSEGKNLLVFTLDEADAFQAGRSADKIFRMCRTSAFSRFRNKFKGFVISYPRSEDGFVLNLYEKAKKNISFYCDKAFTWEVLPRWKFSEKTFDFEGHNVPMDFFDEFQQDPVGAKMMYMCMPPKGKGAFVEDYDKIEMSFVDVPRHSFMVKDYIETINGQKYAFKDIIIKPSIVDKGIKHALCFDLSKTEDYTAIALAHRKDDKVIYDFLTVWIPDKERNIHVSHENVYNIIKQICDTVTVGKVRGDHWNSALMCQRLHSFGIDADIYKLMYDDYVIFKKFLFSGQLFFPRHEELIEELKDIHYVGAERIDHSRGKHDDLIQACIMALKTVINMDDKNVNLLSEGEFISENLSTNNYFSEGATFIKPGINIDGIIIGEDEFFKRRF